MSFREGYVGFCGKSEFVDPDFLCNIDGHFTRWWCVLDQPFEFQAMAR